MRRLISIAAALVGVCALAACTPPAATTAEEEAAAIDAASHDGPVGWIPGAPNEEPTLSWRGGPNAIGFTLVCKSGVLRASAESTGTTAAPLANATPATLFIGAAAFPAPVSEDAGLLTMSLETPLNPATLAALKDADAARIVVGDAFVETGTEGRAALTALAERCAPLARP